MKIQTTGIYKITAPDYKIYIGQSINIENRFKYYKANGNYIPSQPKLLESFRKHGVENHYFEIKEECLYEDLNIKENFYQLLCNSVGEMGLNCVLTSPTKKKPKNNIENFIFCQKVFL